MDPGLVPRRIRRWRDVDEEVDVERPVGCGADMRDVPCRRFRREGSHRDGAEAPGIAHGSGKGRCRGARHRRLDQRSEEHTSELQSLMRISYAVLCLKKTNTQ